MKSRDGFVSNSSSTSFIVSVPPSDSEFTVHRVFKSMEELDKYIEYHGLWEVYDRTKGEFGESYITDETLAKIKEVFDRGDFVRVEDMDRDAFYDGEQAPVSYVVQLWD